MTPGNALCCLCGTLLFLGPPQILPLLVVPLTFILIPDARTTDNIVVDTEESNTPGSHTSDGDVSELLMSDFNGLAGNDDEDA